MGANWDPKISGPRGGANPPQKAPKAAKPQQKLQEPPTPSSHPKGSRAKTHPEQQLRDASHPVDPRIKQLKQALATGSAQSRTHALREVFALARSYPFRRSPSRRRQAAQLMDAAFESDEADESFKALRGILQAEGRLLTLSAHGHTRGCAELVSLLQAMPEGAPWEGLAKSTLSGGLVGVGALFPHIAQEFGETLSHLFEHAVLLAEEAIVAEESSEALAALGRVLSCSADEEAWDDARNCFERALSFEADNDFAQLGMATVHRLQNRHDDCIGICSQVIKSGFGYPHPYYIRALSYEQTGHQDQASADISRALTLAPDSLILQIDAARIAGVGNEQELRLALRETAPLWEEALQGNNATS